MGKSDGRRHPYAWNPVSGWVFLRSSKSYQEAIEAFKNAAVMCADDKVLKIIGGLEEQAENGWLWSDPNIWQGKDIYLQTEPSPTLDRTQRWSNPQYAEFIFGTASLPLANDQLTLAVDTNTPHYEAFLAQWGDIIRFPIPSACKEPPPWFLNAVWTLRPAIIATSRFAEIVSAAKQSKLSPNAIENIETFTVVINKSFSLQTMTDEIKSQLQVIVGSSPTESKLPRPRWDDVADIARVIEMLNERDPRGKPYGAKRIGKRLAPPDKLTDLAKEDWAKEKVAYYKRTIAPFFERSRPKPH